MSFTNAAGGSSNYVGNGNLFSVRDNISIVNGAGRDLDTLFSAETRIGAIIIRNGEDDSDTSVAADTHSVVGGPIRITSGAGKDLVFIDQGRVGDTTPAVDGGPVQVNNGDGGSDTVILATRLAVRGSVDVTAWDGGDRVWVASEVDRRSIAGRVAIDIGPGNDQLVAVMASADGVMTIGRSLGIWTEGSVAITLSAVDVRSWTEIATGDGADGIWVTGSTFGGSASKRSPSRKDGRHFLRNGNGGLLVCDLTPQPSPGEIPEEVGLARGDAEQIGRLKDREAGEVAQLDEICREGVLVRQLGQGLVQCEQVVAGLRRDEGRRIEVHAISSAAVPGASATPDALDQNAAHRLGRGGEEVPSAVPVPGVPAPDEADVCLVDQGGGLEGLAGSLGASRAAASFRSSA